MVFLTAVKTIVPLLLLGMVNKDDYAGDFPSIQLVNILPEATLSGDNPTGNNSVGEEILC